MKCCCIFCYNLLRLLKLWIFRYLIVECCVTVKCFVGDKLQFYHKTNIWGEKSKDFNLRLVLLFLFVLLTSEHLKHAHAVVMSGWWTLQMHRYYICWIQNASAYRYLHLSTCWYGVLIREMRSGEDNPPSPHHCWFILTDSQVSMSSCRRGTSWTGL